MHDKYDQIVSLDFETYFSSDYSLKLKKYNTSSYVRDPQYKTQCVGIQIDTDDCMWFPHEYVKDALETIDWSRSALLCHHTAFDGLILSHHYGIFPAYCLDTLSMGRALHSNGLGASLDELAAYYKLGNKLPNVLKATKGIRELPPELMDSLGQYCAIDTQLCRKLFDKMIDQFQPDELDLIDMTIRMFTEPVLELDTPRIEAELANEKQKKKDWLKKTNTTATQIGSNEQFANKLREFDVDPPTKISPTTGKEAYAFAKNDMGFQELLGHPKEEVRDLVATRMAIKSTIGETRATRFLTESAAGSLPVYLSYFGAHTGRWSGGNKLNMQNLKRGGELRRSVLAPKGHVLVVVDSAQIEARTLAWLAEDNELLQLFRQGEDVYKYMAADIYGKPVEAITKAERFVGKVAVLGLGYNMGWRKFQWTLATGAMGPSVVMDSYDCQNVVHTYRNTRWPIPQLWKNMQSMLQLMLSTDIVTGAGRGSLVVDCENKKVYLPNGMYLEYPGLQVIDNDDPDSWSSTDLMYFDYHTLARSKILGTPPPRKNGKKIYGGLFTENITQALARIIVSDQMLAIERELALQRTKNEIFKVVTMTHDEVVACVPAHTADETYEMMLQKMTTPPDWCSDLPLDAEGGYAENYSK